MQTKAESTHCLSRRAQVLKVRVSGYVMLAFALIFAAMHVFRRYKRRQNSLGFDRFDRVSLLQVIIMFGMAAWALFFNVPPWPPFGF